MTTILNELNISYLTVHSDYFGPSKWPFQGLSDLKPREKEVTLNGLVVIMKQWSNITSGHDENDYIHILS